RIYMATTPSHDELVNSMTGGMATRQSPFSGTDHFRADGRPTSALRAELRAINDFRNAWTCISSIALPVLLIAAALWVDLLFVTLSIIFLMGFVQNRMFILHHEGAHRLLFSNRKINDFVGITIFGWLSFGTGTHAYRRAHTHHHRDEFGPKEPDFLLYALYPITSSSMRRKLRRDATGVSGYRILRPRLTGLFNRRFWLNSLRFYMGQLFIFSLFWAAGSPFAYLYLWLLPFMTVYQVVNRLRAIAEHGGMTRSADRRQTTHHVRQGMFARIFLVPLAVGHHLAHHVDSGVPFRNLPRLTRLLEQEGYITEDSSWPNYRTLWRALAAKVNV
ncbi:MAG: fatty acid desaturase, partial [Actinomycetota bacterium]|nr:fatty acid desaturase [Actinomycetota bacterium]